LSHLVGSGSTETSERGCADDAAETAEVELRENLDDEDVVAVEVVLSKLSDRGSSDNDVETRVGDLLEDLSNGERLGEGGEGERRKETKGGEGRRKEGAEKKQDGPSPCASPRLARS
jgi:hypothetical protein